MAARDSRGGAAWTNRWHLILGEPAGDTEEDKVSKERRGHCLLQGHRGGTDG